MGIVYGEKKTHEGYCISSKERSFELFIEELIVIQQKWSSQIQMKYEIRKPSYRRESGKVAVSLCH